MSTRSFPRTEPVDQRDRGWRNPVSLPWLPALLAIGGFLLWAAAPPTGGPATPQIASVLPAAIADTTAVPELPEPTPARHFAPIEDLTLGRRVKAHNPLLSDAERDLPEPTPETHRAVAFRLAKPDGTAQDAMTTGISLRLDEERLQSSTEAWIMVDSPYGPAVLLFANGD